jgi:ubiquinone/menaquinone biosynthesis C-methylase UbiE
MKDIVANRKKINLGEKLNLLKLSVKENGIGWTSLLGIYYVGSAVSDAAFGRMMKLRESKGLPGVNSADINREIWQTWNWDAGGEEWTISDEWKASLLRNILEPNVSLGSVVVEIGPGAGRWTEHLVKRASKLTGIDISQTCVNICTQKFGKPGTVEFRKTEGCDLPGIADGSLDVIWSFDVFVHINQPEVKKYLGEFARTLKPGGKSRAIIHHGSAAGVHGGWRSNLTTAALNEMAAAAGLKVEKQFQRWTDPKTGQTHEVGLYQDLVTVLVKA